MWRHVGPRPRSRADVDVIVTVKLALAADPDMDIDAYLAGTSEVLPTVLAESDLTHGERLLIRRLNDPSV